MAIQNLLSGIIGPHKHLKALVYRGPATCEGCPEAVGDLLKSSPSKIRVSYVGPDEKIKLTPASLEKADIYVQPGGGDMNDDWKYMEPHVPMIQDFVRGGGRYMGFCLGAYMAGHTPGFGLLAPKDDAADEESQPGSQVKGEDDAVIQVDWTFSSGSKEGITELKRWLFFQDGAVIKLARDSKAKVLGRYSSNGDVAASLSTYGKGWVGLVGPHPEADEDWYDDGLENPDGIHFDIGHDFVEAVVGAGHVA